MNPQILKRIWRGWGGLCVLVMAVTLGGCGSGEDEAAALKEKPEERADTAGAEKASERVAPKERQLRDTALPGSAGLFLVSDSPDGGLRALGQGDESRLEPTNAERGFGFERPGGVVLESDRPLFVLRSSVLELSTLRLTHFAPDALLPKNNWTASQDRGRFGWLPSAMVRLVVEPLEEGGGQLARLQPVDALAPGFYVLHDGAITRASVRKDVPLYYPFQIAPAGFSAPEDDGAEASMWLEQVMPCAREIERALIGSRPGQFGRGNHLIGPDREGFARVQGERIRFCAAQLFAVLESVRGTSAEAHARAALYTLQTLMLGPDWPNMPELLEATDPQYATAALLDFWLTLEALEMSHVLLQAISDNNDVLINELAPRLATYYQDRVVLRALAQGMESPDSQQRLLWPPFFLDRRWTRMDALSRAMGTPIDALAESVTLIAAHHAKRLKRFEKRYESSLLIPLVDAALADISPQVLVASDGLDLRRAPETSVVLGTLHVSLGLIAASDKRSVQEGFKAQKRTFKQCLRGLARRKPSEAQGVFLAVIEFRPGFPDGTMTARLAQSDEIQYESAPFGDKDFHLCLSKSLPQLPTYYGTTNAIATIPVAFNGDQEEQKP